MAGISSRVVELGVVLAWASMVPVFLLRRGRSGGLRQRDRKSLVGMLVQGLAFALSFGAPMPRVAPRMNLLLAVFAVVLAAVSAGFVIVSIRTLGREWSLTARVLKDHRLVTGGPYSIVRNPIYTGMWGLQLATAIVFTSWWGTIVVAGAVYYLGTIIRIRSEDRLLRAEFGRVFDDYAGDTPALLPYSGRRRQSL